MCAPLQVKAIAPNSVPLAWVKAGALCLLCPNVHDWVIIHVGALFEKPSSQVQSQSTPPGFEVSLAGHQSLQQPAPSSKLSKDADEDSGEKQNNVEAENGGPAIEAAIGKSREDEPPCMDGEGQGGAQAL